MANWKVYAIILIIVAVLFTIRIEKHEDNSYNVCWGVIPLIKYYMNDKHIK